MNSRLVDAAVNSDEGNIPIAKEGFSLRHKVSEALRLAISEGLFLPGQRLVERELCELTQVSRTCIRECLRQLESEGVVVSTRNKGVIVTPITRELAEQVFEAREVLEALAGRLFVERACDSEVEALAQEYDRMKICYRRGDRSGSSAATKAFYEVLLDGCRNTPVRDCMSLLIGRIIYLRTKSMSRPGRAKESLRELSVFVAAVMRRDAIAAAEAAAEHVRRAKLAALETVDCMPELEL